MDIQFNLNGEARKISVQEEQTLLWVLRTDLGLTGTKYGCGQNQCGACTVLVNGEAVRSCTMSMKDVKGKDVLTIEGLETNGKLHPLQQAFVDHDALQCGFCTPGMIMNALALLTRNPTPNRVEIIEAMEENLCRCGAHPRIIAAIEQAAGMLKGEK